MGSRQFTIVCSKPSVTVSSNRILTALTIWLAGNRKFSPSRKLRRKRPRLRSNRDTMPPIKKAALKALVFVCAVCKSQMPDPKTYKQHFENKHPKSPLPEELIDVVA